MLEATNSQHTAHDNRFAEFHKKMLEKSSQRQNEKKMNLLLKARITSNLIKKVQLLGPKVTEQQKLLDHVELWRKYEWALSSLSQIVEDIMSNERFKQHRGIIGVRMLLSDERNRPIQQIIDANLVPRMIEFMQIKEEPLLQLEAAWALANVASGTTAQTQIVLDKGALPWFIQLLRSNNRELNDQAIWALGNIAGDSSLFRDKILASGALYPLLKIVEDPSTAQNIIKNGIWMISNLCRGRPSPPIDKVKSATPVLCKSIQSQTDIDVLTDAAETLSFLSRTPSVIDDLISYPNTVSSLISLLSNPYPTLMFKCLRVLGQICTGNEAQTDAVVDHPEFFAKMFHLIDHRKKAIRREAIWILSNIAAGSENQRKKLFQSFPFVNKLISCIELDIDEIKREALYVFANTLKHQSISDFLAFKDAGLLDRYISILKDENNCSAFSLKVTLQGINFMLQIARKMAIENNSEENLVLVELEKAGVLDSFETLQDYNHEGVYEYVANIIKDFIPSIELRPKRNQSEDSDEEEEDSDESD